MDSISYAKNKEEECLNVSITIHTPRKLIHKHPTVFAISLLLFFVGVLLGFKPEYSQEVLEKVKSCKKECCFVVTERHDMLRRPWKPIWWVIKNKIKLALNIPVSF